MDSNQKTISDKSQDRNNTWLERVMNLLAPGAHNVVLMSGMTIHGKRQMLKRLPCTALTYRILCPLSSSIFKENVLDQMLGDIIEESMARDPAWIVDVFGSIDLVNAFVAHKVRIVFSSLSKSREKTT